MNKKLNRVLLIDDDEATNFLNRHVIENAGVADEIMTVLNGKEAIDFLSNKGAYEKNGPELPQPMLILLDINMPVMDGWEFLEAYQKLPEKQKCHTIVVMVTTSFNPDDRKRAERIAELADYRNKPLTPELLEELMTKFFSSDRIN